MATSRSHVSHWYGTCAEIVIIPVVVFSILTIIITNMASIVHMLRCIAVLSNVQYNVHTVVDFEEFICGKYTMYPDKKLKRCTL